MHKGTVTRTSERSITITGVDKDMGAFQDYPFTLEATTGLFVDYNCKGLNVFSASLTF